MHGSTRRARRSLQVAGINIEDSTDEKLIAASLAAEKVQAIKAAAPDLFVNARVDTYWLGQDDNLDATLERASAYVTAGADGIFVPGTTNLDVIGQLAEAIPLIPAFQGSAGTAGAPWAGWAGLSAGGKAVLAAAMVAGRLETLAILVLLSPGAWRR